MTKEFIMEMDVINTAKKSPGGIVKASLLFVRGYLLLVGMDFFADWEFGSDPSDS